ncbi:MAG TPA: IS630 family transposase [Candidatus Angelobacter sp.]|nr:IS630 family transposase [Candidatus Angelobacter sp.]
MRVAPAIVLSDEVRLRLQKLARGRATAVRIAQRSRIVLLAGEGLQNKQIARQMKVAPRMAALWRERFLALGVDGLLKDAGRPGRTPSIAALTVTEVIEKTTRSKPVNATQWSRSTMAREAGISASSVGRIWRSHGLKPHRITSFKLSNDPNFADKLDAIVGLYLNPSEHALVLSVDEKSQIQALDRTQPGLPLKKGRCQTMTHDYKRNGTTTLFAARNVASGEVFGLCQEKHRHQEWLKFLRMIDQTIAADKQIYLICDNYSTHKHEKVQRWLEKHKRFHVRFTPTSASWLNMVERFFRDITQNRLRRGIFHDLEQLIMAIGDYIDGHNQNPKPFIWTAKANDILEKVTRARATLNK